MRIETATLSDVDLLVKLNQQVQSLHLNAAPHFFRQPTRQEVAVSYREFLRQEHARGFIAYVEDRAVGYLLAVIRSRPENAFCSARTFMYVDQISVEPIYQGHGVGRGLMAAVIRNAEEAGLHEIEVETWAFNTVARGFFRAVGFEPKTVRYRMNCQV